MTDELKEKLKRAIIESAKGRSDVPLSGKLKRFPLRYFLLAIVSVLVIIGLAYGSYLHFLVPKGKIVAPATGAL